MRLSICLSMGGQKQTARNDFSPQLKGWRGRILAQGLSFVVVLSAAGGTGSLAFAGDAEDLRYAPHWTSGLMSGKSLNSSYLNGKTPAFLNENIFTELLDADMAEKRRFEYERMMLKYEERRHHSQNVLTGERAHVESLTNFSQGIVADVKRAKVTREREKLTSKASKIAKDSEVFDEVKAPIGIAAALFAIYNGKALNFDLERTFRMEARTDVPDRAGEFKLTSPLIDSAVRFQFADQTQDSVVASLSGKLNDRLRCILDASRSQESIRLEYGFHF